MKVDTVYSILLYTTQITRLEKKGLKNIREQYVLLLIVYSTLIYVCVYIYSVLNKINTLSFLLEDEGRNQSACTVNDLQFHSSAARFQGLI